MASVAKLHEEFIEKSNRPMTFGRLPIKPVEGNIAIIPVDRWTKVKDPLGLKKTYKFMSSRDRNAFVNDLLEYEEEVQHNATITIEEGAVTLHVFTKSIDQITELDREYAKSADTFYREVVYNPIK